MMTAPAIPTPPQVLTANTVLHCYTQYCLLVTTSAERPWSQEGGTGGKYEGHWRYKAWEIYVKNLRPPIVPLNAVGRSKTHLREA